MRIIRKMLVAHFGRKKRKAGYYLNGERLQNAAVEENLEALVHEPEIASMQVQQVITKVNGMSGFISVGMEYHSRKILLLQLC